ncbi:MAG TPA: ribonuclease Z [Gemmatimonadales bacterium]|nr:ribonuclease Z [Gemmatimonadales bacterium]
MLSVLFLGTSAARPTVERNVTGLMITREGESLLVDPGEGTQRQMMRYGASFAFREVFVSHFHADHYLGLIGLVRTLGLQGRTEPLVCYGPRGARRVIGAALALGFERSPFEVEIVELESGQELSRDGYVLSAFAVEHGAGALGLVLREAERPGRFDPDAARAAGVPEGPLWGELQRGRAVTLPDGRRVGPEAIVGAPRPGRKLVYAGDTRPCAATIQAAVNADLLIHEATFGAEEADRARDTQHATAAEAAQVAKMASVRQLVLTHVSARYSRDSTALLEEARAVFPETAVAKDGYVVEIRHRD